MFPSGPTPRWLYFILAAWFTVAIAAGATGAIERLQPPGPQLVLLSLTAALLLLSARSPTLRAWLEHCDPRLLVAPHLSRFVGLYFLWLYDRDRLPFDFAVPGGVGDVLVASFAMILLVVRPGRQWRRAAFAWGALGSLDILFVVITAARLALANPKSMAEITRLPLSLLPTFLVPLIIATHIWLLLRLLSDRLDD